MDRSESDDANEGEKDESLDIRLAHFYSVFVYAGDGLHKEIRFRHENTYGNLLERYLRSEEITENDVIKIANKMLFERRNIMEQISKGLAIVYGKLTFEAAVRLIMEYVGTITGGMEFELNNFTDLNDWAEPRKWIPNDGDYHRIRYNLRSLGTTLNEWIVPGRDWLFENNMAPSWKASDAELYQRTRQGYLLFGKRLPEPKGWDFSKIRKKFAAESVPCEENVVSDNELICSFLGQTRCCSYREYRVRYTNEMVDFVVPNMSKLMVDVAKMISEHENSSPSYEDFWISIRNAITPNNAKYLYAMMKQGKAAIRRFEKENCNDECHEWQYVSGLNRFFRFFSRTIHFESPVNKKRIPNIVHMSGDGVSGVEFIRSIKYQKDGVPDYGEYTFGVEEPQCEEEMFPPLPKPVDRRDPNKAHCPSKEERRQKEQEEEEERKKFEESKKSEESKTEPSQEPKTSVSEKESADDSKSDRKAPPDVLNAELSNGTPLDSTAKTSTGTTVVNGITGKNTTSTPRSEITGKETVVAPQLLNEVSKSKHTGTSKDQNIKKNEAPVNHTSSDNKTPKLQSKQKSAKNQKKANKHKEEPVAKKELVKKDSVDSSSSSQSPPSTEFSGSAGDTRSGDQSETEAGRTESMKANGDVAGNRREVAEAVKADEAVEADKAVEMPKVVVVEAAEAVKTAEAVKANEAVKADKAVEADEAVQTAEADNDMEKTVPVPVRGEATEVDQDGEKAVEDENVVENAPQEVNNSSEVIESGPTKTSIRKAKKAAKLQRENEERAAKAAAKLKAHEKLIATAKDGSFTEAEFDITIKGSSSSSSKVVPKDPNNVIVESNFSGEKAAIFVNDMLLAAAGDLFKVPDVPGKQYDIQYSLLEEEEAENSDEYVPGSTVFHDYRPGVRGNRSRSSSHEGTSNDVHYYEPYSDEFVPNESSSNQPGTSDPVNNDAVAKPGNNRNLQKTKKGKGHAKKSGKGKAGKANGGKATTETSTLESDETRGGPLNPHNGNTPMIDVLTPAIEPLVKLARVSDPDTHDMCRRLKFLADKKAIGGLLHVEKRFQSVVRQRLLKFHITYLYRLRVAKAMLYIIDIDPCEDLSGEKELAVLRLALSYSARYKDAEDCIQGRQIDELTNGGTFMNGRESDSIEKGLRFVDLKLAELRQPDPTHASYYAIASALNRATDEQKLLVSLIGDRVNFSGYREYL